MLIQNLFSDRKGEGESEDVSRGGRKGEARMEQGSRGRRKGKTKMEEESRGRRLMYKRRRKKNGT